MPPKRKKSALLGIYNKLYAFYGPQHWWPGDSPFEVAVGAILTQNTNWSNVEKAIANLKAARMLSARALHGVPAAELAFLIRPSGYFNIKAGRLKAFIAFISTAYRSSMKKMGKGESDSLRQELLNVHGIGPETADSILLYALGKPMFVIDAYTKRVMSRHGVLNHGASYDTYQQMFHKLLVNDIALFNEYHALLVRVGKDYCRPKPRCRNCPLTPPQRKI